MISTLTTDVGKYECYNKKPPHIEKKNIKKFVTQKTLLLVFKENPRDQMKKKSKSQICTIITTSN